MFGFHGIADYYEVFSDGPKRLEREGPLLRELLERTPGKRVVDMACGSGLHARFFADVGARVSAFDIAREMIQLAQTKGDAERIDYRVSDMRSIMGGPWDLALCLGNSMSLLPTASAVQETFNTTAACLKPGSLFLVQILNYSSKDMQAPRHRIERKDIAGVSITGIKNLVPDGDHTLLAMAFFAHKGNKVERVCETSMLQHLDLQQLSAAANAAGLELVDSYGGYDKTDFDVDLSSDLLAIFGKA